jgi:hypothetical protein
MEESSAVEEEFNSKLSILVFYVMFCYCLRLLVSLMILFF